MDRRLLVVTDLDATLLDEAYRYDDARPALAALRRGGHALVLASSKTLAEMQALATDLDLTAPIIAENGGVIAWPAPDGWRVDTPGVARSALLDVAHAWRSAHGARFEGFADWTDAQVAERTGLTVQAAALARDRHATEPIAWDDTDAHFHAFEDALAVEGIRAVRGGRFVHLMGAADKAWGLRAVRAHHRRAQPDTAWTVVALGDSPNDAGMLSAADIAVVIPNPRHDTPLTVRAPRVIHADAPGPAGWNTAILTLLDEALDG